LALALIATDFSDEANRALRRAVYIATDTGMRGAVHVLPSSLPANIHVKAASQAQLALALLADEINGQGLSFEPRLLSGDVASQNAE
jgi:hypothetical protein